MGLNTETPITIPHLREIRTMHLIFPGSANHYDTLFGGRAMAWMDEAAFICATRWCRRKVVTAHSSAIDFHQSIPVGTIVELIARIEKVGRTSMTVQVQLWFEPMDRPERALGCQGHFVLVAVDEHNQPVPVPTLDEQDNRKDNEGD
jgi:acyl-CoA hydrolase